MYVASDPRAKLAQDTAARPAQAPSAANYARFYETTPQHSSSVLRTWYARAQNFVVAYSESKPGAAFVRVEQPDEFMLLLPDAASSAILEWNGQRTLLSGHSVTFVPAGASRIEMSSNQ